MAARSSNIVQIQQTLNTQFLACLSMLEEEGGKQRDLDSKERGVTNMLLFVCFSSFFYYYRP